MCVLCWLGRVGFCFFAAVDRALIVLVVSAMTSSLCPAICGGGAPRVGRVARHVRDSHGFAFSLDGGVVFLGRRFLSCSLPPAVFSVNVASPPPPRPLNSCCFFVRGLLFPPNVSALSFFLCGRLDRRDSLFPTIWQTTQQRSRFSTSTRTKSLSGGHQTFASIACWYESCLRVCARVCRARGRFWLFPVILCDRRALCWVHPPLLPCVGQKLAASQGVPASSIRSHRFLRS